jgi:small subunit ribosomal protein MRP21
MRTQSRVSTQAWFKPQSTYTHISRTRLRPTQCISSRSFTSSLKKASSAVASRQSETRNDDTEQSSSQNSSNQSTSMNNTPDRFLELQHPPSSTPRRRSQQARPGTSATDTRDAWMAFNRNRSRPIRDSNFVNSIMTPAQRQTQTDNKVEDLLSKAIMSAPSRNTNAFDLPSLNSLDNVAPTEYPTLNSRTGRSIPVKYGLPMAIRQLDGLIARNKVRRDAAAQRFHERPGLKRKRVKRQRWAKRFKEGFLYLTSRIKKLRRQGW